MNTPQFHGAKGDGADETRQLQSWFDSGGGQGAGRFRYESLTILGNTSIEGIGTRGLTLYSPITTATKIANRTTVSPGDQPRIDRNIRFTNVVLEGDAKAPIGPGIGCFDFTGVDTLTFERCVFRGHRHFVIVLSNNARVRITDCLIDDWGVREPYSGPFGQREAGTAIFGWTPNYDVVIRRTLLRNGRGGGIWIDREGEGLIVEDCVVDGASEFAFDGMPRKSRVRRNRWRHIRRDDPSGHGAEIQGEDFEYSHNEAFDCDGAGHYFTDVRYCRIEDNRASFCNQGDPRWSPMSGAYIFRTASADLASRGVSFARNYARMSANRNPEHAVSFVNFSGNPQSLVSDFTPSDNDLSDAWRGGAVGVYPDARGVFEDTSIAKRLAEVPLSAAAVTKELEDA